MKTQQTLRTMLYAAACFAVAASGAFSAAHADVRVNAANHHHTDIAFRGDDVVITANDRSEARITPAGDLYIEGDKVAVTGAQRALLQNYAANMHGIETHGLAIGQHALSMVGGMLGSLVAEALAGEDDDKIEAHARAAAEPIKEEARALCKDVQSERALQDQLSAQLPAFKPYAVIDTDSEHDCHIDDREV